MRENCQRVDIVGMGCSAGLNGLNTVYNWCNANPNKNALLICVEICSAIYTMDETPRTAVVNSLFGDGAAIALIRSGQDNMFTRQPKIIDFESHLIPEHIEELRFDWDEEKSRYNFFVGKNTPHLISAVADQPLIRLLERNKIQQQQIKHWILHGGGNSVLTGIQNKLSLSDNDLIHTRSVLKDFGNLSSGSFLFSFKRLIEDQSIQSGDFGLMITMGPGLTIEMALLEW
jgi:alkylresorcinol/alkylpyrone synthase/polyketide synthase Type III